jgi:hypothetical protein
MPASQYGLGTGCAGMTEKVHGSVIPAKAGIQVWVNANENRYKLHGNAPHGSLEVRPRLVKRRPNPAPPPLDLVWFDAVDIPAVAKPVPYDPDVSHSQPRRNTHAGEFDFNYFALELSPNG